MNIWKLEADANNYSNFTVSNEQDLSVLLDNNSFNGAYMSDRWNPIQITIREEIEKGDMQALFGGIPVLNAVAINILMDLLDGNVELLKLDYDMDEYYAVNLLQVLDCIDYQRAIPYRFEDGRIWGFEKYDFLIEKVQDRHIFKNIDERKGFPLVSDTFRDSVIQNNLKGFLFTELWSSDNN